MTADTTIEQGKVAEAAACANCGATLGGPFCAQCGQNAHVHRSFAGIGHELVHGILHIDGKIVHTLKLLIRRPGELTRRYIDGERVRFLSPFALFLFAVFVTFMLFSALGTGDAVHINVNDVNRAQGEIAGDIRQLENEIAASRKANRPTADLEQQLAEAKDASALVGAVSGRQTVKADISIDTGFERLDHAAAKLAANPGLVLYKMQSSAYKYAWLLIPVSMAMLWLVFPFNRRWHPFDHYAFVTYSIAFALLYLAMLRLIGVTGLLSPALAIIAMLVIPAHMFIDLRGFYGVSRGGALWRTVALSMFALIILVLFALLTLLISGH